MKTRYEAAAEAEGVKAPERVGEEGIVGRKRRGRGRGRGAAGGGRGVLSPGRGGGDGVEEPGQGSGRSGVNLSSGARGCYHVWRCIS